MALKTPEKGPASKPLPSSCIEQQIFPSTKQLLFRYGLGVLTERNHNTSDDARRSGLVAARVSISRSIATYVSNKQHWAPHDPPIQAALSSECFTNVAGEGKDRQTIVVPYNYPLLSRRFQNNLGIKRKFIRASDCRLICPPMISCDVSKSLRI